MTITATVAAAHPVRRLRERHAALALASFAALAVLWTWPLASRLTSRVPNDPGDPVLNVWILWWNAQALPLTERWWSPPIFVPFAGSLTLSEHLLGLSVFATPLQIAGASALTAYNVLLLLSFALSGFFAYLLAFRLTGSKLAAACAGLAFGFAPYRAGHLAHIQVLTSQWMPLLLLGMHTFVDTGRRPWLLVVGAAWLLQALSNGYYLLFLPALIVPWIAWFTPWRAAPRRGLALAGAWAASSIPLIPVLLKYHAVHSSLGIARSLDDIRHFSATTKSFFSPPPALALWFDGRSPSSEGFLFPGVTATALVLAGVAMVAVRAVRARRRPGADADAARDTAGDAPKAHPGRTLAFYAAMTVVMYVLALGPGGEPGGPPSLLRPYSWLLWLPGFDGLRVPARFAMPGTLCLAVAAACTIGLLVRSGGRVRTAAGAAAVIGVALDGLTRPIALVPPPQRLALPDLEGARVIEIPVDDGRVSVSAMYRAMFHGLPLVNGYSGHVPHHYAILSRALWYDDPSVLDYLAQDGPLVIVVNRAADPGGGFLRAIAERTDASPLQVSGVGPVFVLPPQPWRGRANGSARIPAPSLRRIDATRLEVNLGMARDVNGIAFPLRDRFRELPERMLIEASEDGEHWRQAWAGWTGALAMDGALQDPRAAPVRIPFTGPRTRYLRIYPAPDWLDEELEILLAPRS